MKVTRMRRSCFQAWTPCCAVFKRSVQRYGRTSHRPPLAEPLRHRRPSLRRVAMTRSTVLIVTPRAVASCDTVCRGSDCRTAKIFPDITVGDSGNACDSKGTRRRMAVKRQASRSSLNSISGQQRRARVMPELRPWYRRSLFATQETRMGLRILEIAG